LRAISLTQSRVETAAVVFGFSLLMGLLARIAVPLPFTPVPVTGQTLGVLLAGLVLGAPAAAAAMLLYLAQGLAGLPVFSPAGPGGAAQLFGPTGGFLLSYPLAAYLVGWISRAPRPRSVRVPLALVAGEIAIFTFGALWLGIILGRPAGAVLSAAVWPFLPGEVLKMALAVTLAAVLRRPTSADAAAFSDPKRAAERHRP